MSQTNDIPIYTGFYESEASQLADQQCINLFPKHPEKEGALSGGGLFRIPGITQSDIVNGAGRGMYHDTKNNYIYIIAGETLHRKDALGVVTNLGWIGGTGRVSMAFNGTTLTIIVPGGEGYFYTLSNGLVAITDPVFLDYVNITPGGVSSVCLKDNRFVYTTKDEWFIGSTATVNDGQDFDALDYEDAEISADPIVRCLTVKNELYIFGKEVIELYQSTVNSSFPFTRIRGATIEKGLVSRFSLIPFDNSVLFLGSNATELPAIWQAGSSTATKISSSVIDAVIQSYTAEELENVTAWSYTDAGAYFAGFNFPDRTFVYDATASEIQGTPVWHERQSAGSRWRVEEISHAFGKNIVTDCLSGVVGYLDRSVFTEYTGAVSRTFTTRYITDQGETFFVNDLELKVAAGKSNPLGDPGDDASVLLEVSTNGGNTWNNVGARKIGRDGEWGKRLIWRRLGRIAQDVMFRFTCDDPMAFDIFKLTVRTKQNVRKGA